MQNPIAVRPLGTMAAGRKSMAATAVGTAPTVDVPAQLNIASAYIDGAIASGHGQRVAYVHGERKLTYLELQARVNQLGNVLLALGIEMEHRVAVLLPNVFEFPISFFGAAKIGAVPTAGDGA